jgi:hypothetical protein
MKIIELEKAKGIKNNKHLINSLFLALENDLEVVLSVKGNDGKVFHVTNAQEPVTLLQESIEAE